MWRYRTYYLIPFMTINKYKLNDLTWIFSWKVYSCNLSLCVRIRLYLIKFVRVCAIKFTHHNFSLNKVYGKMVSKFCRKRKWREKQICGNCQFNKLTKEFAYAFPSLTRPISCNWIDIFEERSDRVKWVCVCGD